MQNIQATVEDHTEVLKQHGGSLSEVITNIKNQQKQLSEQVEAIKQAQDNALSAFNQSKSAMDNASIALQNASEAYNGAKTALSESVNTWNTFLGNLKNAFNSIKNSMNNFANGLNDIKNNLTSTATEISKTCNDINTAITNIGTAYNDLYNKANKCTSDENYFVFLNVKFLRPFTFANNVKEAFLSLLEFIRTIHTATDTINNGFAKINKLINDQKNLVTQCNDNGIYPLSQDFTTLSEQINKLPTKSVEG